MRPRASRYNSRAFDVALLRQLIHPAMELAKSFEPRAIEAQWYPFWESNGLFKPSMNAGAPAFCIQLPPPNVTGTLHMGHAFQQTLMDVLIRYHRMRGDNTLWQVGTDHAGIATQIVVENQLQAAGHLATRPRPREIRRAGLGVEGANPDRPSRAQMRRLGASCDWSRERFTMDPGLSAARLSRPSCDCTRTASSIAASGWSTGIRSSAPRCPTSRSKARRRRARCGRSAIRSPTAAAYVAVATTRPETMLGDVAVAVNPDDERYAHLVGKEVELPLTGRRIPDHRGRLRRQGLRHGLRQDHAGARFQRLGRRAASRADADHHLHPRRDDQRQRAGKIPRHGSLRRAQGRARRPRSTRDCIAGEKPHKMVVPRCERTGEIIEPMLTDQWFVAMTKTGAVDARRTSPASRSRTSACRRSAAASADPAPQAPDHPLRARALGDLYNHWLGQRPRLVHLAPVVVGTSHPGVVRRRRQRVRGAQRRRRGAQIGQAGGGAAPGRRRARHLVLVGAVVPLDARLARGDAGAARRSCRARC